MPKYEFAVAMTCEGCSGAVTRVLNKAEGISNFEVKLEDRKVFVLTERPSDEILAILKKTGKETTFVGST